LASRISGKCLAYWSGHKNHKKGLPSKLVVERAADLLKDVHERFDCIVRCYCLMGNRYHLLLETPNANLSRIMRHINGVYAQAYNRLKNIDGSLFRGRFKSILVDKDAYILQLKFPDNLFKKEVSAKKLFLNDNDSHLKFTDGCILLDVLNSIFISKLQCEWFINMV